MLRYIFSSPLIIACVLLVSVAALKMKKEKGEILILSGASVFFLMAVLQGFMIWPSSILNLICNIFNGGELF